MQIIKRNRKFNLSNISITFIFFTGKTNFLFAIRKMRYLFLKINFRFYDQAVENIMYEKCWCLNATCPGTNFSCVQLTTYVCVLPYPTIKTSLTVCLHLSALWATIHVIDNLLFNLLLHLYSNFAFALHITANCMLVLKTKLCFIFIYFFCCLKYLLVGTSIYIPLSVKMSKRIVV